MDSNNVRATSGKTEIFRMPSADATVPDLMASQKPVYPTLTIVKGPHLGDSYDLDTPVITLGRDPSNSIFLNDMTVSRHHARMDLTGIETGRATITDLSSLNGTWVDGAIVNDAELKDGSTIQIGTFRLIFHTNKRQRAARQES
jgi:pSer/pThr/pTyr-binding forkhead associated (FHA) protein